MKKYIVREGDTMWNVSKATGVRLNLLMAANPQVHDPNRLQPGSVLSIPELGKEPTGSAATPGPTTAGQGPHSGGPHAHGPAKAGQVTPSAAPGQVHAGTAPYFGFVWPHVVQPGESWDTVAGMYNVPVDSLRRMNPRQTSGLQPGDVIYVPGTAGQVPGAVPASHPHPGAAQGAAQGPWGWQQWPAYGPGGSQQYPPSAQTPGYGVPPQMSQMPQMPGYAGGGTAMPQMPGYAGQWPELPTYPTGDGPHTHNPIRNAWYDNMVLPPYPVYVPAVPNTQAGYGVPLRDLNGYAWNGADHDDLWQESTSDLRADGESDGTFFYREGSDPGNPAPKEAPRRPSETWHWPDAVQEKDASSRDLPDAEA